MIDWRREPASGPDDGAEPAVVEALRREIEQSGPVMFARFMERALYEPKAGYYSRSTERTTPQGDFVTAPELHPIFGWTLARVVDDMWQRLGRPSPFTIREYGAGSGALFLAILDGLVRLASPLAAEVVYEPVDLAQQTGVISARLAAAGHGARLRDAGAAGTFTGLVLANEFLDALPVHRVVQRGAELRELFVGWREEQFVEVEAEPSTAELARWFDERGISLADDQRAEVNLAMLEWVDRVGQQLERGYMLVIDYGADAVALYDAARRPAGTLRAFSHQRVSSDVLGGPGRRDITAHVDFDALEGRALAAGFSVLGRRRLAEFLLAAGLDDAYAAARAAADSDWDAALRLRGAVRRLVDPQALGGYACLVMNRNVPEPSTGLAGLGDARR